MEKNILIAGKDLPSCSDFADEFALNGFNVAVTGNPEDSKSLSSSEIKIISWNKSSAISARSLIIQAETLNNTTTEAILYFDAPLFTSKFSNLSTDLCAPACDSMILGFQYLTLELLTRIKQHKTKTRIIFILKTQPTLCDINKSNTLKRIVDSPANTLVASAEAAFATFTENISTQLLTDEYAFPLLITGDTQNETMQKDSNLASWLKNYIELLDSKKTEQKTASWIKAGTKPSIAFSLFH